MSKLKTSSFFVLISLLASIELTIAAERNQDIQKLPAGVFTSDVEKIRNIVEDNGVQYTHPSPQFKNKPGCFLSPTNLTLRRLCQVA